MSGYAAKSRYRGATAEAYNAVRSGHAKWRRELEIMDTVAAGLETSASVLDVPIGTGRFTPSFKAGNHPILGVDISRDMLLETRSRAEGPEGVTQLLVGDAETLPLRDGSLDYVVCMRLLNWVSLDILRQLTAEFLRVSRRGLILEIRVSRPIDLRGLSSVTELLLLRVRSWGERLFGRARQIARPLAHGLLRLRANGATMAMTQLGYTIHSEADVEALFEELGLIPIERHLVDDRVSHADMQTHPYFVYVLARDKALAKPV